MTPRKSTADLRARPSTDPIHACGHPRTKSRECVVCKRKRANLRKRLFRCGHAITPENIKQHGKYRRCLQCAGARSVSAKPLHRPIRPLLLPPLKLAPVDHQGRSYPFPVKRSYSGAA